MSRRPRILAVHAIATAMRDAGIDDRSARRGVIELLGARGRFGLAKGAKSRITPRQSNRWIADAFLAGESVDEIALRSGLSTSGVRSVIGAHDVNVAAVNAERRAQKRIDLVLSELSRRMANPRPCSICGAWVLRGDNFLTCSPECAAMGRGTERFWFSGERHERHRVHQARTILRRPEKYKPSAVVWAERMLSDDPPPPNRTWVAPHKRELARSMGVENLGLERTNSAPCSATNADGSACRRKVTEGTVCYIHAAVAEVQQ